MTALAKYDAALNAIAEAKAVDELLDIHDKADALRAAARVAGNKQAEIDMAEIRFRAERRLGEMMAAQREAGLLNEGAKGVGTKVRVSEKPTLAEVGIDKNLADRARKLAAIPTKEFDGIVGEWRERVERENVRVTVNLLKAGDRAEGRRENDFYPTPESLVAEIAARWNPSSRTVWEPCAGDGRVADALRAAGFEVVAGDIAEGADFFALTEPPAPGVALCTNPPFERVREFIDHAFAIGIREMCLVLPERLWACGEGRQQFDRHRPAVWVNMDWREDYLGKGGSPDRALAVAIWDSPCAKRCDFTVWTREASSIEVFDPETGEVTTPAEPAPQVEAVAPEDDVPIEPSDSGAPEPVEGAPAGGEEAPASLPPVLTEPERIAALALQKNPRRPHCLRPEMCGSSDPRKHCFSCQKAYADANGEAA